MCFPFSANTPWNRVRLTRGFGTRAASRAMKSSGLSISIVTVSARSKSSKSGNYWLVNGQHISVNDVEHLLGGVTDQLTADPTASERAHDYNAWIGLVADLPQGFDDVALA
jgi:hypothetical protein